MNRGQFIFDTSDMAFHCTRCGAKFVPTEKLTLAMFVSVCNNPCTDLPSAIQAWMDDHGECLQLLPKEESPAEEDAPARQLEGDCWNCKHRDYVYPRLCAHPTMDESETYCVEAVICPGWEKEEVSA